MATARHRIKVSYTDEELAQLDAQRNQVRLSRSEFLRRISLGHHLPDANEFAGMAAIGDLLSVNADLARVGNLLKLAIDEADGQFGAPMLARIEELVLETRNTQTAILGKVEDLHFEIHPRRKRRT
jgi:hypothetical protein